MKFNLTLFSENKVSGESGEAIPTYLHDIIKQLLANSVERQLGLTFNEQNQRLIAEEIGYRNALFDVAAHFVIEDN